MANDQGDPKDYGEPRWKPNYGEPAGPVNPAGYDYVEQTDGTPFGDFEMGSCYSSNDAAGISQSYRKPEEP